MTTAQPEKHAILVAVENFHDSTISSVKFAENDARELSTALELHGYSHASREILLSASATKTRIESVISTTLRSLGKRDELLLFYAGHGFSDAGHNYLTCYDTIPGDLANTSIRLQWLLNVLKRSDCEHGILLLDCCRSGLPIDESMRGLLSDMTDDDFKSFCSESEYHLAFAACKPDQESFSSGALKHGIWSYHLIEAFKGTNTKALERGKYLTASSLQSFLSHEVPRTLRQTITSTKKQTPQWWGSQSREIILADFTDILAKRKANKEAGLGELRRVSFVGCEWGAIKSLSGFKRGHRVPDSINSHTRSFVQSIGSQEISEETDRILAGIRQGFSYKRRDLTISQEGSSASIITPDFTVNVALDIDSDDPSQYMLEVQVTEIQNPPAVADTAFSSVFDGMFDRMVFELTGTVSVTSVIDKIEELDDRDRISVDYDKDAKECTISVANFGATIKLSSHELVLIARRKCRVSTLLEAFKRLPLVLSEGKLTLLLPEPDEKVE